MKPFDLDLVTEGDLGDVREFLLPRERFCTALTSLFAGRPEAEFDIMYGQGISRSGDVLDCAVAEKIIEKSGSWYSYDNSKIGQGRENVKIYLESNPDIM